MDGIPWIALFPLAVPVALALAYAVLLLYSTRERRPPRRARERYELMQVQALCNAAAHLSR